MQLTFPSFDKELARELKDPEFKKEFEKCGKQLDSKVFLFRAKVRRHILNKRKLK